MVIWEDMKTGSVSTLILLENKNALPAAFEENILWDWQFYQTLVGHPVLDFRFPFPLNKPPKEKPPVSQSLRRRPMVKPVK